jgi:hypothetical protein
MHFKEVGYDDVNGIKLAEDKDWMTSSSKNRTEPLDSIKYCEILTKWGTIGF